MAPSQRRAARSASWRRVYYPRMNLERFRALCLAQPGATEQMQWRVDAVFKVGGKMFAVACTDATDYPGVPVCSFKCSAETFVELCEREDIVPAPYMARAQWVALRDWSALTAAEFAALVAQGYALVRAGLPKRTQATLPGATGPAPKRAARRAGSSSHRSSRGGGGA